MDFHKLQHKLFEMDPTDPREDLRKLAAQAQGNAATDAPPAKDYVTESVDVPDGSMPLGIDSVSDFAKLAGVTLNEGSAWDALKHGSQNYNKLSALNPNLDNDDEKDKDDTKDNNKQKTTQPVKQPVQQKTLDTGFPKSDQGHTLAPGDDITYVNKKGQRRTAPAVKMLKNLDTNGKNVIQLQLNGATFAISRDQIIAVNGKKFTLTDPAAGKGKLEALEARVDYLEGIIESLVEGKKVPSLKPRDPSAQYMNDLRKSGAMGAHKDKKKDAKSGKVKHKGQQYESIKDQLWAKLNDKS